MRILATEWALNSKSIRKQRVISCREEKMHTPQYHEAIREYLRRLAHPKESWDLHMSEVVNRWFDLYRPGDDPAIVAAGVLQRGRREFETCFSKQELEAMRAFHRHLASVAEQIGDETDYNEFRGQPPGMALAAQAKKAFSAFEEKRT